MTSFEEQKKAQENKYAHEEELKFKSRVRATKLFGAWAAEKLGVPAEGLTDALINLTTAGKPSDELVKHVLSVSAGKGEALSADVLAEKFNRCLSEAKEQLLKT